MKIFIKRSLLTVLTGSLFLVSQAQERFIEINSKKVWINTVGIEERADGEPLIVFQSGLGTPMDNWNVLLEDVQELGPVLTYDRPGVGKSEPTDMEPNITNVTDHLLQILDQLKMEPPYLLVGHSLGGVYVKGFAHYYPDKLAGIIMVDPADFTETLQNRRDYYEVLDWSEDRITQEIDRLEQARKDRNTRAPKPIAAEREALTALRFSNYAEISGTLPNIPVHILTGGRFDYPVSMRSKEFDEEALFRSKMKHRVARWTDVIQSVDKGMLFYSADAGHFVHIDDPGLVISSIRLALDDYRKIRSDRK